MTMTEDQLNLIRNLNFHIQKIEGKIIRDEHFWLNVCKKFPEFVQISEAYRAITEINQKDLDVFKIRKVGSSWAEDIDGLISFLDIIDDDDGYSFFFTKAEIKSFNLAKFAKYLSETNAMLQLPDLAQRESELILIEYIKEIDPPKIKTLEDIKKLKWK